MPETTFCAICLREYDSGRTHCPRCGKKMIKVDRRKIGKKRWTENPLAR